MACALSMVTARADLLVDGGFEFVAAGTQALLSFLAATPAYERVMQWNDVSLAVVPELPTFTAGLLLLAPLAWSSLRRLRGARRLNVSGPMA